MPRRDWNTDEQLLALRLYCLLPFGKLHQSNPDVIAVSESIGRTPSAVAMKACNFASLDPALDRKGLGNVSQADKNLWTSFQLDSDAIATQAEIVFENTVSASVEADKVNTIEPPQGETEFVRHVRTRRVQSFFRRAVMVGYDYSCAISGLSIPDLLIASHIIPWSIDEKRRADPTNGIALNALYDRAFDRGHIAISDDYHILLSKNLQNHMKDNEAVDELFKIEGKQLNLPHRFLPDLNAIKYHRENVFKQ